MRQCTTGACYRLTMPANPFRPVTVIVDVAAVPGVKLTLVGLAVIVKS